MTIDAEVTAVETTGDRLRVTLQGSTTREADWRPTGRHEISLPDIKGIGKTFFVGRRVRITMDVIR